MNNGRIMDIIFKKSVSGRRGLSLPALDVPVQVTVEQKYRRTSDADLCELSELDVVRHFTALSRRNFGVDTYFYPLGSCTMKYNPKICEKNRPTRRIFLAPSPASAAPTGRYAHARGLGRSLRT